MNVKASEGENLFMGNDFYDPTGYENEGLSSGRNLEGQIALWHPVLTSALQMRYVILF